MFNFKNAISVSGAIALATSSVFAEEAAKTATVQPENVSTLRAYRNLLQMFPEGMKSAQNLAEMQEKNRKDRNAGGFEHDTEADLAVLKVMSAFYKDVTGKDYSEGTDDPRAPLEEIQPALMKLGIFLDFFVDHTPASSSVKINLFTLDQERMPSEIMAKERSLELAQGASVIYRRISGVIMGQVGSSDHPSGYVRLASSRKYLVIIDEDACRLLSGEDKEAAYELREKLFMDEILKIKAEDPGFMQNQTN